MMRIMELELMVMVMQVSQGGVLVLVRHLSMVVVEGSLSAERPSHYGTGAHCLQLRLAVV